MIDSAVLLQILFFFFLVYLRQASFKLSWCCKGELSDQHKHDVVSFEKGNITTAERSSKQVLLLLWSIWLHHLIKKFNFSHIINKVCIIVCCLIEKSYSFQISLKWESSPKTVLVLTKPNSISVRILCAEMIRCGS